MPGSTIIIRELANADCHVLAHAFASQGWNKPVELFERYLSGRSAGKRSALVAEIGGDLAGYVTVDWIPEYPMFKERSIPEIVDLNVLVKFQKRGVGTHLMEAAEQLVAERSDTVGIRVGLDADYGNAQHLYIKRGYLPDGLGISQRGRFLKYGDAVTVDDDLTIGFTKSLK